MISQRHALFILKRQLPKTRTHPYRSTRSFQGVTKSSNPNGKTSTQLNLTAAIAGFVTVASTAQFLLGDTQLDLSFLSPPTTQCESNRRRTTKYSDAVMLGPTAEPSTGILFPRLCNGMTFVGCGVRVKWRFVKVYAVGTYVDPIAMSAIKKEDDETIGKALLDPMYPRTIRIVMNRSLSIKKYMDAIVEALEPRMNGEDLDKLEEFKKLNPPVDLIDGAEMEMTIRGDTMLYKNSTGGVGAIKSDIFCRAMCDVYYGADAVSPDHKMDVIKGIKAV